jgi:hypothetical protein
MIMVTALRYVVDVVATWYIVVNALTIDIPNSGRENPNKLTG